MIDDSQATETNLTVLLIDSLGLSHYTSYLASGLSKYYKIILCGFSKQDYLDTGAKDKNVKIFPIAEKLPKGTSLLSSALRIIFLFNPIFVALTKIKYDVVHIQGHVPMFFLFIPMLKLRRKRIFWTIHDVNLRPSSGGIRGKLEVWSTMILTQPRLLAKYADAIIVHGSLLKNNLISKGVNRDKVYVIPHLDYMYLLNSNNRDINYNPNFSDYILVFGRIAPYKGIDILINAVKIVRKRIGKDFHVLIAGKGDVSYFKDLLTPEELEYIHIRNEFIPNSQIRAIFEKARFVVLPYTSASQSGVISLAYTFSKAVIVSNVGSIGEYVEHGKTGFIFESDDITQLANYIIELMENDDKCAEMGFNAHKKLLHEMTLEKCCAIINDIYKRN